MTETTQHKSNTPIEWGQAEGFSKYLISTDGQVYSLKRDRLLPQGFMVLELPTTLIDLSAMENSMARMMLETINNMMIELYASMAQAEIEKKEKRQREGIEQKKARGEWDDYGRPRIMDLEEFATHYRLVQQGKKKPFELMRELGMTKPTFYRYKNQIEKGC